MRTSELVHTLESISDKLALRTFNKLTSGFFNVQEDLPLTQEDMIGLREWAYDVTTSSHRLTEEERNIAARYGLLSLVTNEITTQIMPMFERTGHWSGVRSADKDGKFHKLFLSAVSFGRAIEMLNHFIVEPRRKTLSDRGTITVRIPDSDDDGVRDRVMYDVIGIFVKLTERVREYEISDEDNPSETTGHIVLIETGSDFDITVTYPYVIVAAIISLFKYLDMSKFDVTDRRIDTTLKAARGIAELNELAGRGKLNPIQHTLLEESLMDSVKGLKQKQVVVVVNTEDNSDFQTLSIGEGKKPKLLTDGRAIGETDKDDDQQQSEGTSE